MFGLEEKKKPKINVNKLGNKPSQQQEMPVRFLRSKSSDGKQEQAKNIQ